MIPLRIYWLPFVISVSAVFTYIPSSSHAHAGIDSQVIAIGTGALDTKPGILIVGAVDARKQYANALAELIVGQLRETVKADPKAFENVTYYVCSQPSPDAARRTEETPLDESATNHTPLDDDRDGAIDEDGPEDLNGDGIITLMRVADPAGAYIPHPLDQRVLIPVKPVNGETGRYSLYIEGTDNDHDEQWNEDPVGGVDFNRNFPFDYPFFQPGAGTFACCADESKGLADWLWDHPNIAAVITIGGDDNLRNLWTAGQRDGPIVTSPPSSDHVYYEKVAEKLKELAPREGTPERTEQQGSLLKWIYLQYGRWAFGVDPWWPVEPKKEVVELKDADQPTIPGEDEVKKTASEGQSAKAPEASKPNWDEKDLRGDDELKVLKWMDACGVDGFLPWKEITGVTDFPGHKVEVGGFKPFAVKPTEGELEDIAAQQTKFVFAVAGMLPRIELLDVKCEALGEDVYRITAKLINTGALPTSSEMGEITRVPYPLQISVQLPQGASLVAGRQRERIPALRGGGGSIECAWVVTVPNGGSVDIKAESPSVGLAVASIPAN
jgi:hypothetical protein